MCLDHMHNYRWSEAQISRKECCRNRLAKTMKELAYRGTETNLEQWRCCSTVAVAILEQWQRKFRVHQLKDCYLEFLKMKDTRPRFMVALILSYKRSTHKERGEPSPKGINHKETTRKQKSRERLKAVTEEKSHKSIGNQFFLFFSCFLFIYRDVFVGWNSFIYFSITNHELNLIVVEW